MMKHSVLRRFIQILGTILPNSYLVGWFKKPYLYTGDIKGVAAPILNCYACPSAIVSCPAGSAQHFIALKSIPYFVLGTMGAIGISFGRATCGWICPFGFLQDVLHKIGRLFHLPKISLPAWISYGRYLFLIGLVILAPYLTAGGGEFGEPGVTWFCRICPQGALEGGIPQVLLQSELRELIGWLFNTKIIILCSFLIMFFLSKRIFCRAVCPIGAFLGLFNEISILRLHVDRHVCKSCDICFNVCPVEHRVFKSPNSPDCIRCGNCVAYCPLKAVKVTTSFTEKEILGEPI